MPIISSSTREYSDSANFAVACQILFRNSRLGILLIHFIMAARSRRRCRDDFIDEEAAIHKRSRQTSYSRGSCCRSQRRDIVKEARSTAAASYTTTL